MKCLLDTHILLWWLFDDPRLSTTAKEVIAEPGNDLIVSAASAWEISTKHRLGKLPDGGDVVQRLPAYMRKARFRELGISIEHALVAGGLPGPHRDPFDRMLIAQAKLLDIPMVTTDPVFRDNGVTVLW